MKINIRKGVFETNSSSMHSISISSNDHFNFYDKPIIGRFGEFGWGYDELVTPEEKLSYVLTAIQYYDDGINENNITDSTYYIWLNEMIKDYTGHEIDLRINYNDFYPLGYIDHQSVDTLDDFWSQDKETFKENMKELIFNQKYRIIIDNDNH